MHPQSVLLHFSLDSVSLQLYLNGFYFFLICLVENTFSLVAAEALARHVLVRLVLHSLQMAIEQLSKEGC